MLVSFVYISTFPYLNRYFLVIRHSGQSQNSIGDRDHPTADWRQIRVDFVRTSTFLRTNRCDRQVKTSLMTIVRPGAKKNELDQELAHK